MRRVAFALLLAGLAGAPALGGSVPVRARHGMVVSQSGLASEIGTAVLREGGTAVDAAVATALALAVTHPTAGNLGGGGFIVYRPAKGAAEAYDFREMAPAGATPTMFLTNGAYDDRLHHEGHRSVGVPGTVAGLHLAWSEHGRLPWRRLVSPAVVLAAKGFVISEGLARSLEKVLPEMKPYPASVAQFSVNGVPFRAGDILRQPDLAKTLTRIAKSGPRGFYEGETARLIAAEMAAAGGLITREDLTAYRAVKRAPIVATYRGLNVITVPPPSSGGIALVQMLNILEGYDLAASPRGFGAAATVHLIVEAMRRAYADRARHLGDPEANPDLPLSRLVSKEYAAALRLTIAQGRASASTPSSFEWPAESNQTTHLSVVDAERNAVSLTYTLEDGYGSKIVVPGAGFLLNDEMGDFNAGPGLTTAEGLIGTPPNLAAPRKRMLSSMTPTVLARDGAVQLVVGSPGGRTIINTVLLTILNLVDFGMNVQQAVDAPRFHHQWLPDQVRFEQHGLSPDTRAILSGLGHSLLEVESQGVVEAIAVGRDGILEGASDRRAPDGAAVGY
jgi:gamma-glutamyltranspeptidase / glutathione hydrolase